MKTPRRRYRTKPTKIFDKAKEAGEEQKKATGVSPNKNDKYIVTKPNGHDKEEAEEEKEGETPRRKYRIKPTIFFQK